MSVPTRRILTPIFGEPTLAYAKNSRAYWSRGTTSPRNQKGGTGWQACLHGRVQTGDDWAALYVPVEDVSVPDFKTAKWTYYMTTTQTMGANIVIWVHDPDDFDNRAEITQLGGVAGLEKTAGWNAHEFDSTDAGMLFYGEGTTGTGLTAGTQTTWALFQADALFKTWTIYRISIEMGWEASGTFDHVWVAELKLNGTNIPLKPRSEADLAPIHDLSETTAATFTFTVAPKTPFQLLSLDLHAGLALAGTALTITKNAGADGSTNSAWFDTLIYSFDMPTAATTSHYKEFEGSPSFSEDDELVIAQSNTGAQDIGCDVCWKPI